MTVRVLTQQDLKDKKGIPWGREQLRRRVQNGTFPPPFNSPDSQLNLWLENIIDDYLEACAAGRDWRAETDSPESAQSGSSCSSREAALLALRHHRTRRRPAVRENGEVNWTADRGSPGGTLKEVKRLGDLRDFGTTEKGFVDATHRR